MRCFERKFCCQELKKKKNKILAVNQQFRVEPKQFIGPEGKLRARDIEGVPNEERGRRREEKRVWLKVFDHNVGVRRLPVSSSVQGVEGGNLCPGAPVLSLSGDRQPQGSPAPQLVSSGPQSSSLLPGWALAG